MSTHVVPTIDGATTPPRDPLPLPALAKAPSLPRHPAQVTKQNQRKLHIDRFNADEAANEQILRRDLRKMWNICQQIPTWLWHLKGSGQVVFRKGLLFLSFFLNRNENISEQTFFFFPAPQLDLFVARVMFLMITRKSIKPIRQGMSHTSEHSV